MAAVTIPTSYNFADLWDAVVATVPDRTAVVCGGRRCSFAALDARATLLASWMSSAGVRKDDFVGVQLPNIVEHLETVLAAFKLRAVPVNVNHKYSPHELRAVFADSGIVGVVHEVKAAAHVLAASSDLPCVAWTLAVGTDYEYALATCTTSYDFDVRSNDDLYVIYTGGTTGRPKGVVWRVEDAFFACLGGGDPTGALGVIESPSAIAGRIVNSDTFFAVPPLMHAAGMWPALRWLLAGAKVVLQPEFNPLEAWRLVAQEGVTIMNIVADAMARPLIDALRDVNVDDLASLRIIASGGAPLSGTMKHTLVAMLPWLAVRDIYGSSETGVQGMSLHTATEPSGRFHPRDTVILDPETLTEKQQAQVGVIARRDRVPLRYHNDPALSAETFREIRGRRYALTGDHGRIEYDGSLVVLGRGTSCINSGGEKVYPAEVESALRVHRAVYDTMVLGESDERWGQRVVALVRVTPGHVVSGAELRQHCRSLLAGFKIPKRIVFVPELVRSAAGKPDYAWAEAVLRDNRIH